MLHDFTQTQWDETLESDLRDLIALAVREDLRTTDNPMQGDITSRLLIDDAAQGAAEIVSRAEGIFAGSLAIPIILHAFDSQISWSPLVAETARFAVNQSLGTIFGRVRSLLAAERIMLNLLGRLSGIATLTARYVAAVEGTNATIYDTRKTTLGWRRLEKYAVRCGGGKNHRAGLYDAILIKDNHLAAGLAPFAAVMHAKEKVQAEFSSPLPIIEIEVDSLEQLRAVLPAKPDIVLLDNMRVPQLREAVALRAQLASEVQLEASGGMILASIRDVAITGVDRISVGALTHSATTLDLGLDWKSSF